MRAIPLHGAGGDRAAAGRLLLAEIGLRLGITRQAAQQRWGQPQPPVGQLPGVPAACPIGEFTKVSHSHSLTHRQRSRPGLPQVTPIVKEP